MLLQLGFYQGITRFCTMREFVLLIICTFLIIVSCLCHAGCDMTAYMLCFYTCVCFQVFLFFFFLFFHCVSVFCVCSFFISMDLRGLIQIKKEKTERKKIYSLITIQNVVAVCHTVCTHVRGPKNWTRCRPAPLGIRATPDSMPHMYYHTKFRRSNV